MNQCLSIAMIAAVAAVASLATLALAGAVWLIAGRVLRWAEGDG